MTKKITAVCIAVLVLLSALPTHAVSASAYAVIEQKTGRVLYQSNAEAQMPMASTTKVMTALLTLQYLDLDREYAVPDGAVGIPGSSIYLKKGEHLTGRELLYGLMLSSGNDAAYALAILIGGSAESFVSMMNRKAQQLKLTHTHFADPCGLASRNHYTSALDLASLCRQALNHPVFAQVVATQNAVIRGAAPGTVRYLHNKNRILGEVQGGNGIKTGYTSAAGRCLCSSATRKGMTLVCVVLNDHNWFEDSKVLLEQGFDEFEMVTLCRQNNFAGEANILNRKHEKCDILYKNTVRYPLKKGEYAVAITDFDLLMHSTVRSGDENGHTVFYLCGKAVAGTPLTVRRG